MRIEELDSEPVLFIEFVKFQKKGDAQEELHGTLIVVIEVNPIGIIRTAQFQVVEKQELISTGSSPIYGLRYLHRTTRYNLSRSEMVYFHSNRNIDEAHRNDRLWIESLDELIAEKIKEKFAPVTLVYT